MSATGAPWGHPRAGARGPEALTRARLYRAVDRMLRADPAEIRAVADQRLAEVLAAARTVEPYRTLWAGLDQPRTREDMAELPITERHHLQAPPLEARLTVPRNEVNARSTVGTTGVPVVVARTNDQNRFVDVLTWRQFRAQGVPIEARRLNLDLDRRRQHATLEVDGQVIEMSLPESPAKVAEIIRAHDVEVLVACPSVLIDVADALGPTQMKGIVTFGEVRTPADVAALEDAYGVRPMDFYGASEVHVVSWECPSGSGYHVDADAILLEVVDEDGRTAAPREPGWVVVTALWNTAAPIVRYRVEDIATLNPDPCPCGITLPLMGMVEGRTLDWIIAPDGRRVSPFRLVPVTLLGDGWTPHVRRSRVIQRAVDDFLIEVEWRSDRREDLVARMAPAIEWVLGSPVRVECRDVTEIRVGPSEKFRQVVSLVTRPEAEIPAG